MHVCRYCTADCRAAGRAVQSYSYRSHALLQYPRASSLLLQPHRACRHAAGTRGRRAAACACAYGGTRADMHRGRTSSYSCTHVGSYWLVPTAVGTREYADACACVRWCMLHARWWPLLHAQRTASSGPCSAPGPRAHRCALRIPAQSAGAQPPIRLAARSLCICSQGAPRRSHHHPPSVSLLATATISERWLHYLTTAPRSASTMPPNRWYRPTKPETGVPRSPRRGPHFCGTAARGAT
eukprot:COSAG01_NODE_1284_length_10902_cov_45.724799_2_plen_240_part_00